MMLYQLHSQMQTDFKQCTDKVLDYLTTSFHPHWLYSMRW